MRLATYRRSLTVSAALVVLGGLPALGQSNANGTTPPRTSHDDTYLIAGHRFETSQSVDGSQYGLVGNGVTDNTAAFRRLLGHGGRAIHISAGTYLTGNLSIPGDTVLLLDPGVVIKDSGKLGPHDKMITISHDNVGIRGVGAEVLSDRAFYHGGEYRAGVFIIGATNVAIDGLQSSGNSGDGFYIGSNAGRPAHNVTLENCSALHNRRNGLSIVSGVNIRVVNCTFSYTRGTAPQYGIDIEPNDSNDPLINVNVIDVRTAANANGGISLYLNPKYHPAKPISIDIVNHRSSDEYRSFHSFGIDRVRGTVSYNGKKTVTR